MTTASGDMDYDRRAPHLLGLLGGDEGPLADLLHRCQDDLTDIHVRRQPFGARSWVSLYVGMTTVLDVELSGDRLRLRAHETHRVNGGFNDGWVDPVPLDELVARWPAVSAYLDRVIPTVAERHTAKEGRVHAALCSGRSHAYAVADREAAIGFRDASTKTEICQPVEQAIHNAILNAAHDEAWWTGNTSKLKPLGTGLDILATDPAGRLLAIEAKPPSSLEGIAWGPAQVRFYAEIFAAWLTRDTPLEGHRRRPSPTACQSRTQRHRLPTLRYDQKLYRYSPSAQDR